MCQSAVLNVARMWLRRAPSGPVGSVLGTSFSATASEKVSLNVQVESAEIASSKKMSSFLTHKKVLFKELTDHLYNGI